MTILDSFRSTATTMGGSFFVGVLIGYALKKVIKLVSIIVGLFLAGLPYLQYNQIANINWNNLQTVSNLTMQIPGIGGISSVDDHAATVSLAMTSLSIPLTGSMSAGFTLGFMKG